MHRQHKNNQTKEKPKLRTRSRRGSVGQRASQPASSQPARPARRVRDLAQLRPPCFDAGSARVLAGCFLSVETTYRITWRVACHVSMVFRVTPSLESHGRGRRKRHFCACSHCARARNGADATPLLRCRVSPIISPIMRQTWKRLSLQRIRRRPSNAPGPNTARSVVVFMGRGTGGVGIAQVHASAELGLRGS